MKGFALGASLFSLLLLLLPLSIYYADAAATQKIITVSLGNNLQIFVVETYDYQKGVTIAVDDDTLDFIKERFTSDTFEFTYQVSKYGNDDYYVELEPSLKPGKKFEVKFVSNAT